MAKPKVNFILKYYINLNKKLDCKNTCEVFHLCMLVSVDTYGQFHQRFTCSYYVCISRKRKKIQSSLVSYYPSGICGSVGVEAVGRTLMKLSSVVNFANNLQAAFAHEDPTRH
jgi:hypothetical protein